MSFAQLAQSVNRVFALQESWHLWYWPSQEYTQQEHYTRKQLSRDLHVIIWLFLQAVFICFPLEQWFFCEKIVQRKSSFSQLNNSSGFHKSSLIFLVGPKNSSTTSVLINSPVALDDPERNVPIHPQEFRESVSRSIFFLFLGLYFRSYSSANMNHIFSETKPSFN
jgi:hypothetical protein